MDILVCEEARVFDFCHLKPRHLGGPTRLENGAALCPRCHRCYDTDQLTPEEYSRIEPKIQRAIKLYGDWR